MRLIDADALKEWLTKPTGFRANCEDCTEIDCLDCIIGEAIDNAPTVDAVPVVHGHWIYNKDTGEIRCNLCNALVGVTMCPDDVELITEVENFCFNCGAKMDEVSE